MVDARVVLARCNKRDGKFGVRFELDDRGWRYTWAFPINEARASKEGYEKESLKGQIYCDRDYPGCPYCKDKRFVVCSCGKLTCCGDVNAERFTCKWCGTTSELVNYDGSGVSSSEDM